MNLRRGACLLGAVSVLVVMRPALADAPPPIVRVYVAGSAEAVAGARDAIQELCARSNVAVVVHDAASADEALLATSHSLGLADAYLDLRPGTPTRVVVVDGETRQDLERRILPESASLEMSIEIASHVVCAAVESSLAARAQTAASKSARSGPSSAQRDAEIPAWEPRLTVFAAAQNFGAGFRGGVGGALALTANRFRFRPGAWLSISGYPATELEAAGGLASFGQIGVRLMPMVEWQASNAVSLFAASGAGLDRIGVEAESAPLGAVARTPPATVDAMASAMLGVMFRLSRGVGALLALDADVDLYRHRYVVDTGQGSQSFFEPMRTRPVGFAGLCVSFGGPAESEPTQLGALP